MGSAGTSKSTQNTTQAQTSQTNPWAPTVGPLGQIINAIQGQIPAAGITPTEQAAIDTLQSNAAAAPNYGTQAQGVVNNLLAGGPNYNTLTNTLSGYLNPAYLDPNNVPGIQAALNTVQNDVANNINAQFAGAGRDLSGMNSQAVARGIAQAEAPLLLNQYNQNVAAQQGAVGQQSGLDQSYLQNQQQGINFGINTVPQAMNNNAMLSLNASNIGRTLPTLGLGNLESLLLPIAGLGGQSMGTGTANMVGTQTMSPLQQAYMASGAFKNLLGR